MKKELIAAILLIVIIAGSIVNMRYIEHLTNEIVSFIDEASYAVTSEDWDTASEKAEKAVSLWNSNESHANIFLRHETINSATEAIYQFVMQTELEDVNEALVAAELAKDNFKNIALMEKLRFGSVF